MLKREKVDKVMGVENAEEIDEYAAELGVLKLKDDYVKRSRLVYEIMSIIDHDSSSDNYRVFVEKRNGLNTWWYKMADC